MTDFIQTYVERDLPALGLGASPTRVRTLLSMLVSVHANQLNLSDLARSERPQIVAIFDCCHSGDNTRNGELMSTAFADVVEKRIPFSFQQRAWNQFIFGETITEDTIR